MRSGLRTVLIVVALFGCWLALQRNNCRCAAGPDSSGYLNEARLVAEGRASLRVDPALRDKSVPLGFTTGRDAASIVPTYPPGLPMLIAIAAKIGGWGRGAFVIVPLCAIGCLVLIALLARELGLSVAASIGAAILLAAYPIFIFQSLVTMSDVPATFFVLLTFVLALRGRERLLMAVLAGAAFGAAVWIRPTNLLFALPLAFALRWRPRALGAAIAGALPFGIALMLLNHAWYGHPLRTGYGEIDVVSFDVLAKCSAFHASAILTMLTPLVLAAIAVAFDRAFDRSTRAMLVTWFAVLFAFYALYPVCSNPTDARFLLPSIPAVIIGLFSAARMLAKWRFVPLAMILIVFANEVRVGSNERVWRADDYDATYRDAIRWAEPHIAPNSIVMTGLLSGAMLYYTNRVTLRWDAADQNDIDRLRSRPVYALISDLELPPDAFRRRYPSRWTIAARHVGKHSSETLWRLDSAR